MSRHATEDLAILRALPGIRVVASGCAWEVEEATGAVAATPGVCDLRPDKSSAGRTNRPGEAFSLLRTRPLREGNDAALLATGGILGVALAAAEVLSAQGVQARVLSVHTPRPLDSSTVFRACRDTGGLIKIQEHGVYGGLGGLVAETCPAAGVISKAFHRVGLRAGFSTIVGSQEYLWSRYRTDAEVVTAQARAIVGARARVGAGLQSRLARDP
jgi:transketolase